MLIGTRVVGVVAVCLAAAAVWAEPAGACTCADRDERDRLEDGEKALIGRVLDQRRLDGRRGDRFAYRVRVERSLGVRLRGEVEVVLAYPDCGSLRVGSREAMFVRRGGRAWRTAGCSIVDPSELERAAEPYQRPRGSGRAVLLAGGRFGTARVMALDARGRVVGYGSGRGETRRLSVCPGSRLAAELFIDRRTVGVAVRELGSLRVVRSARLPLNGLRFDPEAGTVSCADAQAASVHVGIYEYIRTTRFDRMRIFRLSSAGLRQVASTRGSTVAFSPGSAFVGRINYGVTAVNLLDGTTDRVARARVPELLAVSPDQTRLAFYDRDGIRVVDLTREGADRHLEIGYGGAIKWLASDRLLFRKGGEGRLYDRDLRLVRIYPFFRADGEAQVGDRLYGTDRYRLRSLDLASGRKRTVGQLTDRGIVDLEGLPERPLIEPGRGRPVLRSASGAGLQCRTRGPRKAR